MPAVWKGWAGRAAIVCVWRDVECVVCTNIISASLSPTKKNVTMREREGIYQGKTVQRVKMMFAFTLKFSRKLTEN